MSCPVCESGAEGEELFLVIARSLDGRKITCSDQCHERLVACLEGRFGTHKRVVRVPTGEEFRVPLRTIIEVGIREVDLDKYPRWDEQEASI